MTHRLASHIQEQLLAHECAVLPSLGGFVLEATPARFDSESLLAYPPGVSVHFHEGLTHHDGLLAQSYARRYGISLRRARLMVEDDIRQLRQDLVQRGQYALPGIGTMSLSQEGRILFEEQPSALLNSSSYGLGAVSMPKLSCHTASAQELASPALDQATSEAEKRKYLHLRIPRKAINYAAAAVIAIAALLPWGGYIQEEKVEEVQRPFTASFAPDKESVQRIFSSVDSEATIATPVLEKGAYTSQPQEPSPQKAEATSPQSDEAGQLQHLLAKPEAGRYYVIIATEREPKLILAHYKRAQQETFPSLQLLSGRRVYRISAASFASAQEAYKYMSQLPATFSEAWVYKHP